jgi:hypothetical protein
VNVPLMIVIDELEPAELLLAAPTELLLTAPVELLLAAPVELLLLLEDELRTVVPDEETTELLLTAPISEPEEELPFKLEELEFFLATSSSLGKFGESLSAQDKKKANPKATNAILYNFTILTSTSRIKVEIFPRFVKFFFNFFLNRYFF